MALKPVEHNGTTFVEGPANQPLLTTAYDIDRLIEACFSQGAQAALLYASNMPPAFFDLSSGQAGTILQKLRTYRIRLAVVAPPQQVRFSRRFGEMLADERQGAHFDLFESREQAYAWLEQQEV